MTPARTGLLAGFALALFVPAALAADVVAPPAPAAPVSAAKPATPPAAKGVVPAMPTKLPGGGLEWVASFEDAIARAKKEKKHLLLDFYTDWCGWCKRLDRDVFAVESFQKAASNVLAVKINAERRPELAQRYAVSSYPTLFFLGPDGVIVERIRGYSALPEFTAKVEAIKRGDTELSRMRDAAADPTNLIGIRTYARRLSESQQHEQAIPYWQQVLDLSLTQMFASPANQAGPTNLHREALVELARGYVAVQLDDVARQHFDEALRTYPGTVQAAEALVGLAQLSLKSPSGQQKATDYLQQVLREYPSSPSSREASAMLQQLQARGGPR